VVITGSFYTIGEAARKLKRHRNTIARWIREGKVNAIHLGNVVLIREEDIAELESEETFGSR
jgi:excisionase family DNA binding protein